MPMVSIIMPVYNVENYIQDSIDSVLAQTYTDYELILVDDGSPDRCPSICDEYAGQYKNVQVIHKQNGGLSSARNAGVEKSSGKYILFVDSDDTIEPDLLQKVLPEAEKSEADVTIFGIHTTVWRNGKCETEKFGEHAAALYEGKDEIEGKFAFLTENGMWNYPVDKLYLRKTIVDHHVEADSFFDRVCEDTVFLLDLFPYVKKICVVEGCYYNYAIRDVQSVVAKFIPDRYKKYYARFCKTALMMDAFKPENRDVQFLYRQYCTFIIWAYEFMYHKDCQYGVFQRYRYLRSTFSIRKETRTFCREAERYIQTQDIYKKASKSSQKVLNCILRNQYMMAWGYHILALLRSKMRCRN